MSADDDWLGPVGYKSWNILDDDGFSEDGSIKIVSNGSIGRFPHLFEFKFFYSGFVGSDGGALDSDFAFFDGYGSIKGDFVISFVSIFDSKIKVLYVEVEVGSDKFVFDELPEDSGHLISIKFCNCVFDFNSLGSERIRESVLADG